jgi:SAM-dependent methyltransferase
MSMQRNPPGLDVLEELVMSADIRDRAFAASVLSLHCRAEERERVAILSQRVRARAREHHAEVRRRIYDGTLDRPAFLARLRETPLDLRDHLLEEILDIAYPPVVAAATPPQAFAYCPSGLAEILFMLEHAGLGPGKTFVDLGAGLGKVVLLVALLTGARAYGVEIDYQLVRHARSAAHSLRLDGAHFIHGDIRNAQLPAADIYYMYIPLSQPASVVGRLLSFAANDHVLLFAQPMELTQLPWLRRSRTSSYWLEMYEAQGLGARSQAGRAQEREPGAPERCAESLPHAIADCERRIDAVRRAALARNDGVVTARMTDLEREWLKLSRRESGRVDV